MERIFRTDNGTYDMIWHGQPLKNLKWYSDMVCLGRSYHFNFLKAVFHKFYLVHSWIHWLIYKIDDIILSILQSLMIVKPIFKIGSLNLFSAKTTSRYREILKFPGLWMSGEFDSRKELHPTKSEQRPQILVRSLKYFLWPLLKNHLS